MKQNARPAGPALKHSLGQNFILDPALQQELAGLTGLGPDDEVLEIGAGSGMLTQALADRVKHVTAVELDREMIPYLKAATLSCPNVRVIQGDALRLSLSEVTEGWEAFRIISPRSFLSKASFTTSSVGTRLPSESVLS